MLLKNSNFVGELGAALWGLKERGHYCDLYLKCAGEEDVLLHTCVAAASSPFIQSVLDSVDAGGDKNNMGFAIPVPAVNAEVMSLVAQFMYTGEVELEPEYLVALLDTASYFEIAALSQLCSELIEKLGIQTIEELNNVEKNNEENTSEEKATELNQNEEKYTTELTANEENLSEEDMNEENMNGENANKNNVGEDNLHDSNTKVIKIEDAMKSDVCEITLTPEQNDISKCQESQENDPISETEEVSKTVHKSRRTRKRKVLEDCVDPDEALEQESEEGDIADRPPQTEQHMLQQLEASEATDQDVMDFLKDLDPNMTIKEEITESPVKWSHRIANKDKDKILDLIRKKPKPVDDVTEELEKARESEAQRVVTEEEEASLYAGTRFACPLCERTFFRKFNWVFHLDRQHDVEVESITKNVTTEEIEDGESRLSADVVRMLESEDAVEEEVAGADPGPTDEEHAVLVQLVKARAILQKYRPNKHGGVSRKKRVDKECPTCGKFFKYDTFYEEHVKKHSDPKPYKCTFCSSEYATRSVFLTHMKSHTKGKAEYQCIECGSVFNTPTRLNQHILFMHTVEASACPECHKTCRNEHALRAHIRAVHEKSTFTCPVEGCGKVVAKLREKEHMNIHTKEYLFKCDICDTVYTQKSSLDFHRKSKHKPMGVNEEWRCDQCSQTFVCKQGLDKHMRRHTGEKRFTCKVCGARFFTKGEMQQHEAYHTNPEDRQFVCPVCHKSFVREYSMRNHMLTHTADKPFTCEFCQKKFRWKNKLKEHVRKHTGEMPFKCRLCEARFTDCALRRHHEKKMHGEEIASNPSLLPQSHTRSNKYPGSVSVKPALPPGFPQDKSNTKQPSKRLKTAPAVSVMNVNPEATEFYITPNNAVVINAVDLNKATADTSAEQLIVLQNDTSGNQSVISQSVDLPNVTEEMAKIFVIDNKTVETLEGQEMLAAELGEEAEEDGYVSFIDSNGERITVKYVEESA